MRQEKITKENPLITYCHLLGAMMVFVGHWYYILGLTPPTIFGKGIQGCGVWILFLISGFLSGNSISRSFILKDENNGRNVEWKFILKKCKRVFPPLWLCLLIFSVGLFFISENKHEYISSAIKYLISNAVLIPRHQLAGVFENNPYPVAVNGSLWTLPVEMACFIAVPVLFCLFSRISLLCKNDSISEFVKCTIVVIMCTVIQVILASGIVDRFPSVSFIANSALKVIIWFFVGILVYSISSQKTERIVGGVAVAVFVAVPFLREFLYPYIAGWIFSEIVYIGNMEFADRLPKMANICYGMFLYGFPVEQTVVYLFKVKNETGISDIVLFVIALVLDILLAAGSYYLIEKRSIGKNKVGKKIG